MLAAAALLANGLRDLSPAPQPPLLIAILGLMVFIEASPVSLPGGGYATASTALDLPVLVMLGPVYAAALDVVCTLTVQGLALRKPVVRVAHNAAVFTLDYFIAAQVFRVSGGHIGALRFP